MSSDNQRGMDCSIDRLRAQDIVTLCVATLLCLSVLMVQSAAMQVTGHIGWAWTDRGTRHLMYAVLAIAAFLIVSRLDYRRVFAPDRALLASPTAWAAFVAIALCAAVLVPGIGKEVNGARRWILLGPLQVQPSEIAKWAIVVFLAWWLTSRRTDLSKSKTLPGLPLSMSIT